MGKNVKTWGERCDTHPDHQTGMISQRMIQARMQEEIDELRQALEEWVELTKEECFELCTALKDKPFSLLVAVQEKLREKNT